MVITKIDNKNIDKIMKAFDEYLINNGILYDNLAIYEEEGYLVVCLIIKDNLKEWQFESAKCIGHESNLIAKQVMEPLLEKLQAIGF